MGWVMMRDARQIDALGRVALMTLLLLFIGLVSRQVVRPLLIARHDLDAFRDAVQILSRAQGNLDRIDQEIQQAAAEIAAGEARLPPVLNLDEFLLRTEGSARTTGIRVEAITPREVIEHHHYRELDIDLRVTGSGMALCAFLGRLERSDQLSRVKELRIVGDPLEARCAMELRLALYFSLGEAA
jgi:Tfp pilus assembly protein PilO